MGTGIDGFDPHSMVNSPLAINSRFSLSDLPYAEVNENPNVAMVLTKTGGHIGFLEGWCPTGPAWLNRVVQDFVRIMITSDFINSSEKKEI